MKLLHFNDYRLGVMRGDALVDVTDVVAPLASPHPGDTMNALIACFDEFRAALEAAVLQREAMPLAAVRIGPPLLRPTNFDCMAANYMENGTLKVRPVINAFHKSAGAIVGPGGEMVLPDVPAVAFEGEAELAVVIGRTARNVTESDAMSHVFGYMNFIDGSARGLPPRENRFFQMKSRDTFAPIGPFLVTADEVGDPHALRVKLSVNGVLKQDYNTSDMAYSIPECIAWLSRIHTLHAGDIIGLGTNHRGLSSFQDGDSVDLEIDGLGCLSITCRDALRRTWPRETRLQRFEARAEEGPSKQLSGKYAAQS